MSTVDSAIIKHITEGSNGGGGNEDILKRIPDQTITMSESVSGGLNMDITLPTRFYFYSCCLIRLYNKNSQEYDDLMLIRDSNETSSTLSERGNSYMFIKDKTNEPARAEVYGSRGECIQINLERINSSDKYNCNQSEYPEAGVYEYEYMSPATHRLLLMRPFYY